MRTKSKLLIMGGFSLYLHALFIGLFLHINQHRTWEMTTSFLLMFGLFYLAVCLCTVQAIRGCFDKEIRFFGTIFNVLIIGAVIAGYGNDLWSNPYQTLLKIGIILTGLFLFDKAYTWLMMTLVGWFKRKGEANK